ncbi:response regulator transcription factor [Halobacillus seohaensis]|uniref:Response regulator transcription factor n=1 Tax=Halobacillus seohaensis TaxID=447421 RepID=A0ABW2EK70_9BACI
MTSTSTIHDHVRKLEVDSCQEEQLYRIIETYMKLFPVKNSYLFRYSPLGYLGEGIILMTSSTDLVYINDIRDDIRSLPIIYKSIREKQAKYCTGIEFLKQTSSKYVIPSSVNSMLVVPICFDSIVVGYFCSTEFEKGIKLDSDMLSSFTLYGKLIGKFIQTMNHTSDSDLLSKREFEVMRRIAQGESTKEMADVMKISDATVKQYVKSAIKKTGAHNRTHAVAELFRRGILS